MIGLLSFLCLLCAAGFMVFLILFFLRLAKHKPCKPFIISAVVAAVCALALTFPISELYVPTEKPVDLSLSDTSSEVISTSNVESSVESDEKSTTYPVTSANSSKPVAASEVTNSTVAGTFSTVAEHSDISEPVSVPEVSSSVTQVIAPIETSSSSVEVTHSISDSSEMATSENLKFDGYDSLSEMVLYNATITECPVMNGTNTERIGSYGRIFMSKDDMTTLTSEQFFKYVKNVVCPLSDKYNWFTIKLNDSTGIVFPACSLSFNYGELDSDGTLNKQYGSGFMNESANGFDYYTVEEIEGMS